MATTDTDDLPREGDAEIWHVLKSVVADIPDVDFGENDLGFVDDPAEIRPVVPALPANPSGMPAHGRRASGRHRPDKKRGGCAVTIALFLASCAPVIVLLPFVRQLLELCGSRT